DRSAEDGGGDRRLSRRRQPRLSLRGGAPRGRARAGAVLPRLLHGAVPRAGRSHDRQARARGARGDAGRAQLARSAAAMRLSELVETSRGIAGARARLDKLALLAECLRRLEPAEIPIGVAYLSGHLRQGRIGIGWAALRTAIASADAPRAPTLFDAEPASHSPLTLAEV